MMISLGEYRQIRGNPDNFLTAPGHQIDGAKLEKATEDYAILVLHRDRESNGSRRSA
jgi:hypothetical protein